jgi:FMN phosphatase YigB (HAD superfamily)
MYNTVFIDWYQTLSISTFWSHLTDSHHKNHALYEPLRRALFEEQNQVFEGWLVGNINSERVMEILAQHTGIPYELIWDEFVVGFQHQSLVSEDIYDFIRDLRMSGVKVAIATDNMDCFNRWCVPALKLDEHFDDILNSFNIGHLKKEIAGKRSLFFDAYLERNNIGPGESILFDDSPNVEPATIIAGIEYCRIRSRNGLVTELQRLCENL